MSDTSDAPEVPSEPYEPPVASWRLPVFIKTPLSRVKKTLVDCPTCPVFFFCQEGSGGTGYVCGKCGNTAVWVDEPDYDSGIPKDILILDCNKHKFPAVKKKLTLCAICSGGIMQLELNKQGARNHVVFTVHAGVSVETRHKTLKEAWAKWKKYNAEQSKCTT